MEERKRKIYDLVNIKEWEVRATILTTVIFVVFLLLIDFYNEFNNFQDTLIGLIECLLGALIGLLGFSLSGIAIIVSLFTREETGLIEKYNRQSLISQILSSYTFVAQNVAIQCVVIIILHFLISSERPILNIYFFYVLIFLEIYHVIFIIFYTVALVRNCVKLYDIKKIYNELEHVSKTQFDIVNEIKIDFIFRVLMEEYNCSMDVFIGKLIKLVEESTIEEKEKVIDYIKQQYDLK